MFTIAFGFRDFGADVGVVVGRAGNVDGIIAISAWRRERWLGRIGVRRQRSVGIASTDLRSVGAATINHSVNVARATEFRWWWWVGVGVRSISVASCVIVSIAIGWIVVAVF